MTSALCVYNITEDCRCSACFSLLHVQLKKLLFTNINVLFILENPLQRTVPDSVLLYPL